MTVYYKATTSPGGRDFHQVRSEDDMNVTVDRQGRAFIESVQVGWVRRASRDATFGRRRVGWEYVQAGAVWPADGRRSDRLYRTRHEAVDALVERVS